MRKLEMRLRISSETLATWNRQGRLNEAVIDRYLSERSARRAARELALAAGVQDATRRMRLARGWPVEMLAAPLHTRPRWQDDGDVVTRSAAE